MERKHILHKIAAIAGAAVMGLALPVTAAGTLPAMAAEFATQPSADTLQMDAKGSITVYFRDSSSKKAVAGGEITLYKVADVQRDNADLSYTYVNGFENCGIRLDNLSDSTLPGQLQGKISSNAEKTTVSIGSDGRAVFGNLSLGLYLLLQNKTADNYSPVQAFLVTVPMSKDGTWCYDIDATPKMGTSTYHKPPETPPSSDKPPVPETPTTPTTPDTPTTPETPTTPKKPVIPVTPTVPETPETPTVSEEETESGDVKNANRGKDYGRLGANRGRLGAARLPQTGQLDWPVPVLCIAGLALFAIGFALRRDRE